MTEMPARPATIAPESDRGATKTCQMNPKLSEQIDHAAKVGGYRTQSDWMRAAFREKIARDLEADAFEGL